MGVDADVSTSLEIPSVWKPMSGVGAVKDKRMHRCERVNLIPGPEFSAHLLPTESF